ncbi:MAG: hypothetical protein Q3M24_08375 [Candidatus Electrothrix aestuarii]|uniref:Cyanobacterial TRADD-N associated 2 transmembrane domain-containing protein n=1 Tax=Candidatus Electrothrix aestuarii TaxID=3062594 RepID=A0AAU8M0U7_9BACT|nr:hypothetical protein [Candidatus Electrothrix aestuarii]
MFLEQINMVLYYSARWLQEIGLPFISIMIMLLAIFVAYRKGLFSREALGKKSKEPINITVHGDVTGGIGMTASEIEKLAITAANVDEYHQQSISQSRISFWFSLVLATLGFVIIATSVFTFSDKANYVGIVAGTIVDAVAALFFHQTNRARALMADFFDRLRTDRKLEESLKLCNATSNSVLQDALRVRLALHFSGIDNSEQALKDILTLTTPHHDSAAQPKAPSA